MGGACGINGKNLKKNLNALVGKYKVKNYME
jgi:hypothetical protein